MSASNLPAPTTASFVAATNGQHRPILAEPLWFALMSRVIFGTNAAKELAFLTGRPDRTCRRLVAGDNEAGATDLAALIQSQHGYRVNSWIMDGSTTDWWINVQRAMRRSEAIDLADKGHERTR